MKRYSIFISIALLTVAGAMACGGGWNTDYYLFSVFPHSQIGGVDMQPMYQYWSDYTGEEYVSWEVDRLGSIPADEFATSTNKILTAARQKNDNEMLQYLQLLTSYLRLSANGEENEWGYPTKADKAKAKNDLEYINNRARSYSGSRLRPQYALLQMRTLVTLGNYRGASALWENSISRQQPSVYRNIAQGLYAASQLRLGNREKALATYEEMGDMQSVKWMVRKQRNYAGIKQEYDRDPNSPTLTFLVQDFVNNAYTSSQRSPEEMQWIEPTSVYQDQIEQFCALAAEAVNNKAVKTPCLWQSALGYLQTLTGKPQQGLASLNQAMKMKGTPRMLDNARVCRIFAQIKANENDDKGYRNYLAKELQWLRQMDEQYQKNNDSHYGEAYITLLQEYLTPQFRQRGKLNTMVALQGIMPDEYSVVSYMAIDTLSSQQLDAYRNYLMSSKQDNDLDRWLVSANAGTMTTEYFNDQMGTRLIREGLYEEAIPYLEQVSTNYISKQGISRYMSRRTYDKDRWFDHQIVDYEDAQTFEETAPVSSNQKLDFCRDMVALQRQYAAQPTAETAYKLASLYYQASYKGDCWYLSRYSWSSYDTICYPNEENKMERAVEMLRQAKDAATTFSMQQKATYALAFIPYGPAAVHITYTDDYKTVRHLDRNTYQYQSMRDLAQFYRFNRHKVAHYVSHCDVLNNFIIDPTSLPIYN